MENAQNLTTDDTDKTDLHGSNRTIFDCKSVPSVFIRGEICGRLGRTIPAFDRLKTLEPRAVAARITEQR